MLMKRLYLSLLFSVTSLFVFAQIKVSGYYDGYWGEWEDAYISSLYGDDNTVDTSLPYMKIYGDYSGFCTYANTDHPSAYMFKFQITNYITPDKKTRKYHLKNNKWFEYNGVVEYFVKDEHESIKDILAKGSVFGRIPATQSIWPGAKKRIANATIKIAPYKDHPKVYNIFFEGVGVGIDLNTLVFQQ